MGVYPNNLIHTMQRYNMVSEQTLFYPYPAPEKQKFDYFAGATSIQTPLSQWTMSSNDSFSVVTKPTRPVLTSNPSRKRSRDHLDDEEYAPTPADTNGLASMEVVEEPIYGPGMTLLNPSSGGIISAESQSGTWLEETADEERVAEERRIEAQRPILRPSKSSRLDLDLAQIDSPGPIVSTPTVEIDPASAMLGVGWKVMASNDEDMLKAVRGWARYIEVHYPLHNVQILSKSEGKEAFLVQSDEGYWLFQEDLAEGRLVSTNWQGCIAGLTSVPMFFEGTNTLTAQRSPSPSLDGISSASTIAVSSTGMDLD